MGSAVVEFLGIGLLLVVPLFYLVAALGRVQAAAFATDGAARSAARAMVVADGESSGRTRASAAVRLALRDQGFDVDPAEVTEVVCGATPCLTPGASVRVRVQVAVSLPVVPALVVRDLGLRVTVRAEHTAVVDPLRGGTA
jgi:hypothetical protein